MPWYVRLERLTLENFLPGDVFAMGNNEFGMLGLGDETTRNIPAKLTDFVGTYIYE